MEKIKNLNFNLENIEKECGVYKLVGTKTGYPHIDRPWMDFYEGEVLDYDFPALNIYDYLVQQNKGFLDNTALTYFGRKITFRELYEEIDTAAKVFKYIGIANNDRIMFLMPNIPETTYMFYGASKIGAVSDYVDPRPDSVNLRTSALKVLQMIKNENIKQIVALDQCYLGLIKPIEKELKSLGIEHIIIVSPSDAMNFKARLGYVLETVYMNGKVGFAEKMKKTKKMSKTLQEAIASSEIKIIQYSDLCEMAKNVEVDAVPYEPNKIVTIVHTSGTSSAFPTPIPLTNDNLNSYVHQTYSANMPMKDGDKALHVLPFFAAFGLVDVVHAGLCHNNNLIQVPEFLPVNFGKLILKYKPQTIIGTPSWFINLVNDESLKNADLSFISMITYGGDSMEAADEKKVNDFLKSHGCKVTLTKGHGMSEICGCGSYAIDKYNYLDSMGIPMPYTIYAIVDPITKKMMRFNDGDKAIEGELAISSRMLTPGILDDKVIIQKVNYDGEEYILTKDIAIMYCNGVMKFLSRSDRAFTRFDGFKIKPYVIENVIKENSKIRSCIVSPYYDETKFGIMPMATIVVDGALDMTEEEKISIVKEIVDEQFVNNSSVSSRQMPSRFRIVSELPLTPNGKIAYKKIETQGLHGDEIIVDLDETNISIGDIQIYSAMGEGKKYIKQ